MATAASLHQKLDVRLITPARGAPVRAGARLQLLVDVTLQEPWFPTPSFGDAVQTIDGSPSPDVLCFETRGPTPIRTPLGGVVRVEDTRLDVHTPLGFPSGGAGRGVVATLRTEGGLTLTFGHLERGSTPQRTHLEPGEVIGVSGNTGRCVDGCGRAFVSFAFKSKSNRPLRELSQPLKLRASLDGAKVTLTPVEVPAGHTALRRVKLGTLVPARKPGKKTATLEVELVRGTAATPVTTHTTELRILV